MRYRAFTISVWSLMCLSAGLLTLGGCTPTQYADQADRDAYRTLSAGQKLALGGERDFDVQYDPFRRTDDQRGGPIRIGDKEILIGEGPTPKLTLDECLEIAFRNSRSFQTRKEQLYTGALALANTRRGWGPPLFGGELTGEAQHNREANDASTETNSVSADFGPSLTQKFVGGGMLSVGLALDLVIELVGMNETAIGSLLEANFTQPLLRGAWRGLAYEDQYRRERDFLFSLFEYERFTQTFAVGIIEDYYNVLQRRDQLQNERTNIGRLKQTLALTRVQVEAGQTRRFYLDQAEQNVLNAQIRMEANEQVYRDSLDQFKVTLGLPVEANMELDYPLVLEQLNQVGPKPIPFDEEQAVEVALLTRPDVLSERADLRDAQRDVQIAADAFIPQLDVSLGVSADGSKDSRFHRIRFDEHTRFAKVEFNYQLDQTDNRDDYRESLIALDKAHRDYVEFVDNILLDVRQSYRALVRSRKSYELQVRNLVIAKRRRKLTSLEQKEGEATSWDVLEAEEALRLAQNGVTRQLVDYTNTRLDFLVNLGMLYVDEKGRLHERSEPFKFERIGRRYPHVTAQ